ncbi:Uu.00g013940.m01.CDS01 [Anthostomella pinea]|uniref:Uu.00g013940.m01.CDS01 n=1 Tax=Anthostomella pinea TaxID=933095 RepID=A0AAI8VZ50_9PEZI|nr:Uu.00g013940.m01.CDS01 [Anthostomella pinea]
MPPTPASSTEIKGQDHAKQLPTLQMTFELPPSAMGADLAGSKTSPVSPSTKAPFPVQASETVKSRRRSSAAAPKDAFALPPPPTRSRKIIQMKPRGQQEALPSPSPSKSASASVGAAKNTSTAGGSKKKQPSSTSAAGRKIARKTAHSLIERRRRSKMNEEFAVLKGMIPACEGEMHKLAILQASIEYVRYLEDCISQLKSQHGGGGEAGSMRTPTEFTLSRSTNDDGDIYGDEGDEQQAAEEEEEEAPEDVEMTGSEEAASPTFTSSHAARSSQSSSSISPALVAQDARGRHHSYSSVVSTGDYRHYSFSAATSPAFRPQAHPYPYPLGTAAATAAAAGVASQSALTSPALRPQQESDHEASAALLMLGAADRRGKTTITTGGSASSGRGMSVRDLLSS